MPSPRRFVISMADFGTIRQFAALQRRVRYWGQTSRHRRNSMTGWDHHKVTYRLSRNADAKASGQFLRSVRSRLPPGRPA
jgi:hypothetical protein